MAMSTSRMLMRRLTSLLLASAVLVPAACGAGPHVEFRIFVDPANQTKLQIGFTDLARSSARATPQGGSSAVLFVGFTPEGAKKFHSLTRALAQRGAQRHRMQRFAVEIDGRIYARPLIDYRAFPNGLDGNAGIQIEGFRLADAKRLAQEIRRG